MNRKDVQIVRMNVELGRAFKHYGMKLKNLSRLADSAASKEISQRKCEVYQHLKWPFTEQFQTLATNEDLE